MTITTHALVLGRIARAAVDTERPLLAALTVTRRCNLACSYCFEFDHISAPVPTAVLRQRLEHLARLRTVLVTFNGGEPLLHPHLVGLCHYARSLGVTPMLNTNGFLLNARRIDALGDAGLYGLQLSIDSIEPTTASRKALSVLKPKLRLLARARFRVRVNTVLGDANAAEAVEVVREVAGYGFDAQCSLQRDARGAVMPLGEAARQAYRDIRAIRGRLPTVFGDRFQLALAEGRTSPFRCRAGARYFHVDEHGLVHPCQPRAHEGGVPLADYSTQDLQRAFRQPKPCAARCGHAYAHIGSRLDALRGQG